MANCIVQTGNNAGLNVRAQKTVSSEKLGEIANGASLNVVRCDAVWATFMFNGAPAFVQHKYLLDPPAVNGEGLSVDDGATCNADTVDLCEVAAGETTGRMLHKGEHVKIQQIEVVEEWYWYRIDVGQWVRGDFLAPDGADYILAATVDTAKHGTGGTLNMREKPEKKSKVVAIIPNGAIIAGASLDGDWLAALYDGVEGYVMAKFIVGTQAYEAGGETGRVVTYRREAAVAYARQFTSNSSGNACYNNVGFHAISSSSGGDCANFVSQCLFAGGIPQNNEWYYRTPYTTSGKRQRYWTGTVSMRDSLVRRGWATRLPTRKGLRKGDLVYTYESETSLPHVVIVTEDVDSDDAEIIVCGHTRNQLDRVRSNTIPSVYYHINDTNSLASDDVEYVGYAEKEDFETAMSDFGKVNLLPGSDSCYVYHLKKRLAYLGYFKGETNTTFDAATTDAVERFQEATGLIPDGIVGTLTKAKLYYPKEKIEASALRRKTRGENG